MLGFGGHFLTKARTYSVTFRYLREERAAWRRTYATDADEVADNVLIVNFFDFVGSGWHTTGDAILASTAADMARRRNEAARDSDSELIAA
jgi:hypothetical protein